MDRSFIVVFGRAQGYRLPLPSSWQAPMGVAIVFLLLSLGGGGCSDVGPLGIGPDDTEVSTEVVDGGVADAPLDTFDAADHAPTEVDGGDVDVSDLGPVDTTLGPPVTVALASALEAVVSDSHKVVDTPGLAVGVRLSDGSWWSSASGLATREGQILATAAHAFGIGSITKSMTAAVVLQLVHEGLVSLDAPVDALVPDFSLGAEITIRSALTHTSGVFNFTDDTAFLPLSLEFWEPEAIVEWALEHGSVFVPQMDYSYSNTNYYLLGLTIEAATGKPYHQGVRERVLDPAGLSRSYVSQFEAADSGPQATGYVVESDVTGGLDMSWAWAAGAGVSTVRDLCAWGDAVLFGDFLPLEMREAMTTAQTLVGGGATPYGMGVTFSKRGAPGAKTNVIGHTGSTMGYKGEWFFHAPTQTCVVVLTNNFLSTPSALSNQVWGVLESEGLLN